MPLFLRPTNPITALCSVLGIARANASAGSASFHQLAFLLF
jgi:hypothetical protein